MWLRPRVEFSGNASTFSSLYFAPAQVRYQTGQLIDLGCLPLPPFGFATDAANIYVTITGQKASGWSGVLNHIQICPAGGGLFRRLEIGGDAVVYALEPADSVLDDGTENLTYVHDASDNSNWPIVRPYDAPLMGWPERENRIRVLVRTPTSWPENKSLKAVVWHRPRRLSL
jgi:hypothetical protein